MRITKFIGKDGRQWFWGTGTPQEVESLNVEKEFNSALDTLNSISRAADNFFGRKSNRSVDRTVYGKRKAV